MYGVQLDQLAVLLDLSLRQTASVVSRWNGRGLAESGVLSPGPRWVWLTRAGLLACGARYAAAPPALPRLEHIRAVTSVRLALQATPSYQAAALLAQRTAPAGPRLAAGSVPAIICPTPRCTGPMRSPAHPPCLGRRVLGDRGRADAQDAEPHHSDHAELLTRTGDYGCPAADTRVPGRRRGTPGPSTSARPPRPEPCGGPGMRSADGGAGRGTPLPASAGLPGAPGDQGGQVSARVARRGRDWPAGGRCPVTIVAVAARCAASWSRGWPPGRLYRAAPGACRCLRSGWPAPSSPAADGRRGARRPGTLRSADDLLAAACCSRPAPCLPGCWPRLCLVAALAVDGRPVRRTVARPPR